MSFFNRKKTIVAIAVLYGFILFIGLTVYRLPLGSMIPYLVDRGSKGKLYLRCSQTSLFFPLGCRLEKASFAFSAGEKSAGGRLESLTLSVNLFGMIRGRLPVTFEAVTAGQGGRVQGNAGISLWGRGPYFEVRLTDVDLEKLGVGSFSGRDLKGKLSGELTLERYIERAAMMSGHGRLLLKNGSVDTKMDLAGLKAVPFEMVRIPFTIKNGRLLMEKAELEGPMLSGTVSGQITLSNKIAESVLDLTARLKPGPLLQKNPLAGPLLSRFKDGKREIIMKIGGSLKDPMIAWG